MSESDYVAWALFALHGAMRLFFIVRATLRPHREPASRLAWVVVIIVAPVVGIVAYMLFGGTNIGNRRIARVREALRRLRPLAETNDVEERVNIPEPYSPVFRVGTSISFYPPVGGNRAQLMSEFRAQPSTP